MQSIIFVVKDSHSMLSFGKKKKTEIDLEQHELLENAQKRIKQKKRLYIHFVVFLIGAIFLIIAN